jgi:hypothetical protein
MIEGAGIDLDHHLARADERLDLRHGFLQRSVCKSPDDEPRLGVRCLLVLAPGISE